MATEATTLPSPLSLCCPPPDSPALCPPPPSSCIVVHCHITLCHSPPDCPTLSATCSSCIVHCPLLLSCPLPTCLASSNAPTCPLVSADGVLVHLLLLICFSFWDVVREGCNAFPCKKEKQYLQRLMLRGLNALKTSEAKVAYNH